MDLMHVLEEEFGVIDKDNDGKLSEPEIEQCLVKFGFDKNKAKKFMELFDTDKDGKISKEEFMKACQRKLSQQDVSCAALRRIFRTMDTDNDGKIVATELSNYLKTQYNFVFTKQVYEWIQENDKNNDRKLNYEEFLTFVRNIL